MQIAGIYVKQANADTDTVIVSTALAVAESKNWPVVVVGTDTDLLVIQEAQASTATDIFMICSISPVIALNIQEIQNAVGETKHHLMFLHGVIRRLQSIGEVSVRSMTWFTRSSNTTCWLSLPTKEAPMMT